MTPGAALARRAFRKSFIRRATLSRVRRNEERDSRRPRDPFDPQERKRDKKNTRARTSDAAQKGIVAVNIETKSKKLRAVDFMNERTQPIESVICDSDLPTGETRKPKEDSLTYPSK